MNMDRGLDKLAVWAVMILMSYVVVAVLIVAAYFVGCLAWHGIQQIRAWIVGSTNSDVVAGIMVAIAVILVWMVAQTIGYMVRRRG